MSEINQPLLQVKQLQCIRDDRVLFEDIHFTLSPGELLQIEGPNGSGKTSLLRIVCGLALPTEGAVYWRGQEIDQARSQYYGDLLYMGHIPGIKADLTPLENLKIAQALSIHPMGMSPMEALDQMGLYGFEEVLTRTLSAGQQRRVALARLLVNQALLWVLDEPFTALDKKAICQIEYWLEDHVKKGGMAIVTSHHAFYCKYARSLHLGI